MGHVIFGKEKKRQFGLFFLKKIKTCEEELGFKLLVFGDLSQVRLLVGTPVRVQFVLPLSQGFYTMLQSPGEQERDWSKEKHCRCGGEEDCLLSVVEETMFRPVGEVSARVQLPVLLQPEESTYSKIPCLRFL